MPRGIGLIVRPQRPFHIGRRPGRLLDEMDGLTLRSGSVRVVEHQRTNPGRDGQSVWRRVANIVDRRRWSKSFPGPRRNREPATPRKE
jgi:hypothetical protein